MCRFDGAVPNDDQSGCVKCQAGTYMNAGRTACEACEAGKYSPNGATVCEVCAGTLEYTDDKINCKTCPDGEESNEGRTGCDQCDAGEYRDTSVTVCTSCPDGHVSEVGSAVCTSCQPGTYEEDRLECVDCGINQYQPVQGSTECRTCPNNYYSSQIGERVCTVCPDHHYAYAGLDCQKCPTTYEEIVDDTSLTGNQEEKCKSDLGDGCFGQTITNQYGNWTTPWLQVGKSHTAKCTYDDPTEDTAAVFICTLKSEGDNKTELVEEFTCLKTTNSKELEKVLYSTNKTSDDKAIVMEKITSKTADNGLGDVSVVTEIINDITDSTTESLSPSLTTSILQSVSNLVESDLKADVTPNSQGITQRYE
eukprot:sb/3465929/